MYPSFGWRIWKCYFHEMNLIFWFDEMKYKWLVQHSKVKNENGIRKKTSGRQHEQHHTLLGYNVTQSGKPHVVMIRSWVLLVFTNIPPIKLPFIIKPDMFLMWINFDWPDLTLRSCCVMSNSVECCIWYTTAVLSVASAGHIQLIWTPASHCHPLLHWLLSPLTRGEINNAIDKQ